MNKRIKKKRELENSLRIAGSAIEFLLDQNNQLWKIVERMEKVNSRNVEATNKRFDDLETYQKILEDDVAELKKSKKKSWFSRK
ncbi:MAG: hypothetical protein SPD91_04630 [Streptococcus hyointestinalis]|uniref:hypothetical protein n=1 Tax=Streptococcus hyointestinalis TaxID=1337 RepID=UPI001555712E|nr:hypothetical protein [Streptococcus hyointestinalis]NQR19942.1 hypothetical protein [Streptococcus suis]MDD7356634.1 hypothetical protein [Streptococcus hyointestinalis]MDY4553737.1 hypothetical protein [Streptococcus hyointestinalis]HEM4572287.1 hypothetical protein [Streptococcus suis]HEM5651003.1 hypothetical protein [Streptococcus suis]